LQDKDYKFLLFAKDYIKAWRNEKIYRNLINKRRTILLKKYGMKRKYALNDIEWAQLWVFFDTYK